MAKKTRQKNLVNWKGKLPASLVINVLQTGNISQMDADENSQFALPATPVINELQTCIYFPSRKRMKTPGSSFPGYHLTNQEKILFTG
jgi:hypothetical protein